MIVADNGSTDDTAGVVHSYVGVVPGLRLVDASRRIGSNVARNVGTEAAKGELVLLCDADDVVHEGWLEALAGGLENAEAVGGTTGSVHAERRPAQDLGEARGQMGVVTDLFLPRPISANAGYRRSMWHRLGGFDERYVRGAETEFFWRVQLAGDD